MTLKAVIDEHGRLCLGDAAMAAGFRPGQVVEIAVSRAPGLLLLALDTSPPVIEAQCKPLSSPRRRVPIAVTAPTPAPQTIATPDTLSIPSLSLSHRIAIGAAMIGMDQSEYRARIQNGEKWCSGHKGWHARSMFVRRRSNPDGLDNVCRAFSLQRVKARQARMREQVGQ